MQHTPAPWNWNGTCLVADPTRDYPDGYAVAKVFNESDVALIASAPAMLEALRDAQMGVCNWIPTNANGWRAKENLLQKIDRAIRAATEEEKP